jgi:hypothetical protein
MGHWGVRSDENDDAADALDAGFERVHGVVYEQLMDDRSPLAFEQVQQRLANPETLSAAVQTLHESFGDSLESWDETARLGFAGVVVRHAELGVPIPDAVRRQALAWLENEEIDWEEATLRGLRRRNEIALLERGARPTDPRSSPAGPL